MTINVPRQFLIRDDGSGNSVEGEVTFARFRREDAVVLLGDPGMGKTTLFKQLSNGNYSTVRNFLVGQALDLQRPLFLDALDEYRSVSTGQDATGEIASKLCLAGRPKFRLSCRAADWFGTLDQEALRTASASGKLVVIELLPLTLDQIADAISDLIADPRGFMDEIAQMGLIKLLQNPQTLELFALAWRGGSKPRNKFEAFDAGTAALVREMNDRHALRGTSLVDPSALRRAAGAAASTILLSNSIGIARTEPAAIEGYVLSTCVPHSNKSEIDVALKRRLFTSPKPDQFEPIHRVVAEFLAAEDLARRIREGLPISRVLALMCGSDGRPVSSLRGLFAWLMVRLGDIAELYVDRDPYGR